MILAKFEDFFDQLTKCLREYFKLIITSNNVHRILSKFLYEF